LEETEFVLAFVAVCVVSVWKKQGICISDCGSLSYICLEETEFVLAIVVVCVVSI